MRATSARMISRTRLLAIKLIICEAKLYYTIRRKPEAKWIVKNKLSATTACAQKMRTISRSKVPSFRFSRRIESENRPILSAVTQSVFEENLPWNTVDFRNTFGRITRRRRRMARLTLMREWCLEREIGNDSPSTVCGFEFFQEIFQTNFTNFLSFWYINFFSAHSILFTRLSSSCGMKRKISNYYYQTWYSHDLTTQDSKKKNTKNEENP